jgi:enamine deaminase RidA (YjgF/YER057c/UK114 family)
MAGRISTRLNELGIELPRPAKPVATYVPYVIVNKLVFISGQVTLGPNGLEYLGKVGRDVSIEDAQAAARLCGINILAQLAAACDGDLDRVVRCVKLGGFVNAASDFGDHPKVINGASDLMVEVFGEAGRHARFAVGAGSLPLNVSVEIEAVFEIK